MKPATPRVISSISSLKWLWVSLLLFPSSLWAQNTLEQKSDPAGLFSTTNQTFDNNTSVTTLTNSASSGNYAFTHWTINGTRMNDANGQALHKVQFNLLVNSVAIAHYLNNSVDSDADGIPDWREIKTSGNLNQGASSDLDGDGFSLEQEVRFGLNPSIEDNVTEGGISMRRSKKVFVNLGGARKLTIRSNPAGLVSSQITFPEVNSTYNSTSLNGLSNGYYFSHWEINGVRQADSKGVGLSKVSQTMDIDKEVVAKYYEQSLDSDSDNIPDWYEMHEFGNLSHDGSSDPDGDGFSLADERRFGLSGVIDDNVTEGGISMRRSKKVFVNLGGASKLTVSSNPPGLIASQLTYPELNSTYTSTSLNGLSNSYYFSHWEVNGVRKADSKGVGLGRVTEILDQDKSLVAKYYEQSLDSDADGIPDWYEMHEFGHLSHNGSSDPDGDGFSLADERRFGLSGVIDDNITEGGISMRRSSQYSYVRDANDTTDSDGDGLTDSQEIQLGTNTQLADTDGDGFSDYQEGVDGTNPLSASSFRNVAPSGVVAPAAGLSVEENRTIGTFVGNFSATDANDPANSGAYTYTLVDTNGSNDNSKFSLETNGTLTTNQIFDYEPLAELNATDLSIRVRVSDSAGLFVENNFTVSILNVVEDFDSDGIEDHLDPDDDNDGFSDAVELAYGSDPRNASSIANYPPATLDLNGSTILENQPAGTTVGQFNATDPDANSTLFFSLLDVNGTDHARFTLDQNGTLRTVASFDFESNTTQFTLRARVSDERNATLDGNFTVSILNVVEDLDFDGTEDHFDTDDDGDGFSDADEIAAGTNPRNPKSLPNRSPATLDLNGSTILENQPAGTAVGQFNATDPDANSTLSFSLLDVNGTNHARFTLDQNGTLRTVAPFDFESNTTQFTLRARVSDERNATLDGNFTVSILNVVEDLDFDGTEDHFDTDDDGDGFSDADEIAAGTNPRNPKSLPNLPPSTLDLNGSFVLESLPVGSRVGKFSATDPDPNSIFTFSLVDGNGSAHNQKFSVDTNGTLRTASILDYESNVTAYQVRTRVTDEFNATLEGNFTISLLDALPPFVRTLETVGSNGQKITLLGETGIGSGLPLLTYGFELGQSSLLSNPTIWNGTVRTDSNFSTEIPLAGLQPDTKYFFRAFARNAEGIAHGTVHSFLTPPLSTTSGPWWESLPEIAGGWRSSPWLGTFLAYPQGWIYHADLGWLYAHSGSNTDLWLWSSEKGWLWTGPGIYPYLFQNSSASWLYFIKKKDGKPRFYDYTTKSIK